MADWGTRVLRGLPLHNLAEYTHRLHNENVVIRKIRQDRAASAKAPEHADGRKLATLKGAIQFERYQGCGTIDHT